jgi:DNA replication protein DnaC
MGNRHSELQVMLQSLKLTTMASTCSEFALKAAKEGLWQEAFLYELARLECEQRQSRRIERGLQQSGLPREKTFRTLQLDRLGMSLQLHIERLRRGTSQCAACTSLSRVCRSLSGKSHSRYGLL